MATNKFLTTSELDFLQIRSKIKEYLSGQDRLKDYDFEGSNMAVILDVLAWNTHLSAHYLNQVGSEMFLDTAQLIDSLYSHAKELNYTPRSVTSSRATVGLSIDTGVARPDSVTIPKYTSFTSTYVDDTGQRKSYQFQTLSTIVVGRGEDDTYTTDEVEIVEGEVAKEVFVVGNNTRYVLASADADISTLEVVVQTSNTDLTETAFTRSYNLYGVTATDEVYFVQGAYDGRFEVVFGNGVIGKALEPGNLVRITYLDSSGETPNGAKTFGSATTVEGYTVSASAAERASGGAVREDVESIRYFAPRHFTTQERAVITMDYENLVRERFPQVQSVIAYGGEEVIPKRYGKVVISVKPYGDEMASNRLKNDIISYLTGKNIVTEPIIVDPDYLYLKIETNVKYNRSKTDLSEVQLKSLVLSEISSFRDSELNSFGVDFRKSKFVASIDDIDVAIVSNDTRVSLIKKWKPRTGSVQSLVFSFGNELLAQTRTSDVLDHDPIVYSTTFVYRYNGTNYEVILQDDGAGDLCLVSINQDGSKILIQKGLGTVDYTTGDVSLSLNVWSYTNSIKIYAVPENSDVSVAANRFLTISDEDVSVSVQKVTER